MLASVLRVDGKAAARAFVVALVWFGLSSVGLAADKENADAKVQAPAPEAILKLLKREHPRLLIDRPRFEALAKQLRSDRFLAEWDAQVQREADELLAAPLPRHVLPDGLRLLATSRRTLGRVYVLALAWRLHGRQVWRDRLWKELETVAAFPDFNPRHFLDTAEMTHALAIAYDWLYDDWTEQQRRVLREAIVTHGLKPGLAVYQKRSGWHRAVHNWNQVCNGGMTVGALAVAEEEPALAGQILHHAIGSVRLAMATYAPDGAWPEGPGYWAYATSYNVLMLAALESALGTDFGLANMPGFSQTGLFPIYMTGPTGRAFNFEDSGDRIGRADCMLWLARRFGRPEFAWYAFQARPSAAGMIWSSQKAKDPVVAGLPLDKYWRGVEVATLRSTWNDPEAVFVGIQAGSNRVNHNHLDCGSWVLDALGQRWIVDLGADDYNLPGYFGGRRYEYYRLRAEGHNTLVVNPSAGPDQDPRSSARMRAFVAHKERSAVVADLSPVYAPHVRRAERGVALLQRRHVLLQDEIEAPQPAEVWWFAHTPAEIQLAGDGRSATLQLGGKKLEVRLIEPAQARFEVRPAEPLPSSPNPQRQRPNRGIRKLALHLTGVTNVRLAVLFMPGGSSGQALPAIKPLANW